MHQNDNQHCQNNNPPLHQNDSHPCVKMIIHPCVKMISTPVSKWYPPLCQNNNHRRCVHGEAERKMCSQGLLWDERKRRCDWGYVVVCRWFSDFDYQCVVIISGKKHAKILNRDDIFWLCVDCPDSLAPATRGAIAINSVIGKRKIESARYQHNTTQHKIEGARSHYYF